jgi:NAD(P)-dependent dehydrogenase (short-subunit alcohol dehydrogenase family)
MKIVEGKVAFITGGASGIGLGMAKAFLRNGMKVVIGSLRQESIDHAMADFGGNPNVHAIRVDVTDRVAMDRAADEVENVFGKIHLLCNNAGVNLFVPIEECTYNDWDWMMGVNFGGVVNGIQAFLPRIRKHGEGGHIVNTASMAGLLASGKAGIYTASKFAVRGLSEALSLTLAQYRIGVSVFCPGLVNSAIFDSEKRRPQHLASENVAKNQQVMAAFPEINKAGMEPEEVGEKVLAGIRRNDLYIFSHPEFKEELREAFDEILAYLPDESAPPERLAFERGRRDGLAKGKAAAKMVG